MNIVSKEPKVNKLELIYAKYDDWDLFRYYFGQFKTGKTYKSPLRNDENPSFSFYISEARKPRAHDFALGKNYSALDYVQELYGLSFAEALDKVCSDFGLLEVDFKAEIYKVTPEEKEKIILESKPKEIKSLIKQYNQEELDFWASYGIEKYETLKTFDVFATKKFWINKQPMVVNKPSFTYFFKKSNHIKIYQPLARNKREKWFSNTNNLEDIQGYYQINIKETKPELLVLTSSMKEVMFLWERGIFAMAAHNETCNLEPDFIRHIKKYCKKIVSLYDFDEAGILGGEKLWVNHAIEPIRKPDYFTEPQKDVTDYFKHGDKNQLTRFINEIKTI